LFVAGIAFIASSLTLLPNPEEEVDGKEMSSSKNSMIFLGKILKLAQAIFYLLRFPEALQCDTVVFALWYFLLEDGAVLM